MAQARGAPPLSRITLLRDRVDDWHTFPFNVRAVATLDELNVRERVLFFVGENGSGKSTLLEAIALGCGFGPEGGTRNLSFTTRVSAVPSIDDADAPTKRLSEALRLSWTRQRQRDGFFLRAESFHNFASELDRLERERIVGPSYLAPYGGTSLHDRSHGESFLTLFLERFSGRGLFLLDEPEAALSAARQLALIVRMNDLLADDEGAQFVIATHSPILLAFPHAQIVSFDGPRMHDIPYRQTDAYAITRRFLSDPDVAIRRLLTDSDEAR